jgi:TolA-binding protein
LWLYIIIALLLAIAAVLVGKGLLTSKGDSSLSQALNEKSRELEDKNKQIQAMDDQIAQLRKDLEESSKRMDELQGKLQETVKALSATDQRLKTTRRDADQLASSRRPSGGGTASRSGAPAPSVASRRPADPGTYEVIRATSVFEEPSDSARKLSTINKGTRVNVVRSSGDWLEVRSKHGNPPGYIRRDDAMFIERTN